MSELSTAGWNNCIILLDQGPIIVIEENVIPCPLIVDRYNTGSCTVGLIDARAIICRVGQPYYYNNPKLNCRSSWITVGSKRYPCSLCLSYVCIVVFVCIVYVLCVCWAITVLLSQVQIWIRRRSHQRCRELATWRGVCLFSCYSTRL